ncbi:MAG: hypothetical protein JNN04_07030 [Cyclobacteriaceae bacterium]|nr:hypothetical protein [Cyclobacteriaceae bacterium]
MELLETQDPEKKKLVEASDHHKRAMEKELTDLTQKTDRVLKNALIIGGSLALTFLIVSAVTRKRKKKKKKLALEAAAQAGVTPETGEEEEDEGPSILSTVGTQLLNQASVILLDLARQKLKEYLATRNTPDEHS